MRHISEITKAESAGLWDAVMANNCKKPFMGAAYHFQPTEKLPERVVLMSGVDRLGIYFTGKVWADCDLQRVELDQAKVREYLESIGITQPETL